MVMMADCDGEVDDGTNDEGSDIDNHCGDRNADVVVDDDDSRRCCCCCWMIFVMTTMSLLTSSSFAVSS